MSELTNKQYVSNPDSHKVNSKHQHEMFLKLKKQYAINYKNTIRRSRDKSLIVIIDHDLGGGAELYSSLLISGLIEKHFQILHLRFNYKTNKPIFSYKGAFYSREFIVDNLSYNWIIELLTDLNPDHIFVNELVTWHDPLNFIKAITELDIPCTVFIHDYFHICISWNLINENGIFCNIPEDMEKCKKCLSLNRIASYISFYGDSNHDIILWRREMKSFLHHAGHIVCFSESSKQLLTKVYGEDLNIISIEHAIPNIEAFKWKQRLFNTDKPLTIGIIGNLDFIKGEKILKCLISHSEFNKLPVKLIVTGMISNSPEVYASDNEKLIITGPYNRADLPGLLEKHNVSAVLIPSICPEAFSFTTSEAQLLGYPVICFNIGAPADRIKKYNSGIVIDGISVEGILNAFREILKRPDLIKEFGASSRKYMPPSSQEHLGEILGILECIDISSKTHHSGNE